MTTRTDKSARTAQAILERSLPLFAARGPHAVSVVQVAEASRVSVGSIYVHFGSKDLLYLRVFEDALRRNASYTRERPWSDSALERVCNAGEAYLQFGVEHPDAFRLVCRRLELESTDAALRADEARFDAMLDVELDRLQTDVTQAMCDGEIAALAPRDLAMFLWSTWTGIVALMLRTDRFRITETEARRMIAATQRMMAEGVAPPVSHAGW